MPRARPVKVTRTSPKELISPVLIFKIRGEELGPNDCLCRREFHVKVYSLPQKSSVCLASSSSGIWDQTHVISIEWVLPSALLAIPNRSLSRPFLYFSPSQLYPLNTHWHMVTQEITRRDALRLQVKTQKGSSGYSHGEKSYHLPGC